MQGIVHFVGAAAPGMVLYTPLGNAALFRALLPFLVVPLLVVTGMLMW